MSEWLYLIPDTLSPMNPDPKRVNCSDLGPLLWLCPLLSYLLLIWFFFWLFWGKLSPCSPGCPGTCNNSCALSAGITSMCPQAACWVGFSGSHRTMPLSGSLQLICISGLGWRYKLRDFPNQPVCTASLPWPSMSPLPDPFSFYH